MQVMTQTGDLSVAKEYYDVAKGKLKLSRTLIYPPLLSFSLSSLVRAWVPLVLTQACARLAPTGVVDFFSRQGDPELDGLVTFGYYGDWLSLEKINKSQASRAPRSFRTLRTRDS